MIDVFLNIKKKNDKYNQCSIKAAFGLHGAFWIYAFVSFLGLIFVMVFVPETKVNIAIVTISSHVSMQSLYNFYNPFLFFLFIPHNIDYFYIFIRARSLCTPPKKKEQSFGRND